MKKQPCQKKSVATMKEKIKGWLAGLAFRLIALLTLGQISPMVGVGIIVEQDGKVLLIDRADGLGYTIPGGIIRYREAVEQCVLRETCEETGFTITITDLFVIYCMPKRDPRFRSMSITYMGTIMDVSMHGSSEGDSCWL